MVNNIIYQSYHHKFIITALEKDNLKDMLSFTDSEMK